jgi:hypothetical protein
MEREYIVTLRRYENPVEFFEEMIAEQGNDTVPSRAVVVANARINNKRNTHFMLTDEEVLQLRDDPRVEAVEIPSDDDDAGIGHDVSQAGDFDKPTSSTYDSTKVNWGLRRHIESTDPYTGNTVTGDFTYNLDGTGVDIVIQDGGIQADHPEFEDKYGNSRVQQIDWFAESGVSGTMPVGHYTDYGGHGTHCAGVAAGKTYGWAKNARIYAVKVSGLQGSSDPNGGISQSLIHDIITGWHNNKPVDPNTGFKRPTIVNMSWSFVDYWTTFSSLTHRGVLINEENDVITGGYWHYGVVPLWSSSNLRYSTPPIIFRFSHCAQYRLVSSLNCITSPTSGLTGLFSNSLMIGKICGSLL